MLAVEPLVGSPVPGTKTLAKDRALDDEALYLAALREGLLEPVVVALLERRKG